jgi:cystinosin
MARHRIAMSSLNPAPERETSSTPLLDEQVNDSHLEPDVQHDEGLSSLPEEDSPVSTSSSSRQYNYRQIASLMLSPITDEQDSVKSILFGLLTMLLSGGILGLFMPKNEAFPSHWYRTLSSMIGYTCFIMWSVSFYPQMINNFRRRSTLGLSADFCGLNVLGFACYAVYNVSMFTSDKIHDEYRTRYGADAEITVQSNDVAFAVHAFVMASITFFQIAYYDGLSQQRPSKIIESFIILVLVVITVYPLLIVVGVGACNWLDFLYLLSFVKILVTLIKYVPQVALNIQRKSTKGFSIWQILLDFSGGTLNNLQLVLDSADLKDWSGITGNPAKLCLGVVSIVFDTIFMTQHYILYRTAPVATVVLKRDEEQIVSTTEQLIV